MQAIFHGHPILYVLLFGMIGAKITNRLVVAHMCKGEITNRDASLLAPTLLILNQYFNTFIPETLLLYFSLVWVGLDLVWYCSKVCLEICNYLNVSLFTIPYNGSSETNSASNTNGSSSHSGWLRHTSEKLFIFLSILFSWSRHQRQEEEQPEQSVMEMIMFWVTVMKYSACNC